MVALEYHYGLAILEWLFEKGCHIFQKKGQVRKHGKLQTLQRNELMVALACHHDTEVLEWLMDRGCKLVRPDPMNTNEISNIMWALQHRCDLNTLKWLVQNGSQLGLLDQEGRTEFIYACMYGCDETVLNYLVTELGHNCVNATDEQGFTALMRAIAEDTYAMDPLAPCQQLKEVSRCHVINWFVRKALNNNGLITKQDIDFQNEYGVTALMVASFWSNVDTINALLQVADVQLRNVRNETALHVAITVLEKDQGMFVRYHTHKHGGNTGAAVAMTSDVGTKKQRLYIQQMKVDSVKCLINAKINVDVQDQDGKTAFLRACSMVQSSAPEVVRMLYDAGADIFNSDHFGTSPIFSAVHRGNDRVLRLLLDNHLIKTNIQDGAGNTLLIAAASRVQVKLLPYILSKGIPVNHQNKHGKTALTVACEAVSVSRAGSKAFNWQEKRVSECVEIMLELGANTMLQDGEGQLPLHKASSNTYEIIDILVKHMEDLNTLDHNGNTALHITVQHQKWDRAKLLAAKMTDINAKNSLGKSPLHDVCAHIPHNLLVKTKAIDEMKYVIQYFISRGANVNSKDSTKATPLFDAVHRNSTDVGQLLVDSGADISSCNCLGQTLLHMAVEDRVQSNTLKWILSHNVHVNTTDHFKLTPLHLACSYGNTDAIKLLLAKGANVCARDRNALTAIVMSSKHPNALDYLIESAHDITFIENEQDLFELLRFAQFHHNLDKVTDIICPILDQHLLSLIPDFNITDKRQDVFDCEDEYISLDEWIESHRQKNPDAVKYFQMIRNKYCTNIVPKSTEVKVIHFIEDVFKKVAKCHPALPSTPLLSGSVSEGNKVFQADEYDFIIGDDLPKGFQIKCQSSSPYISIVHNSEISESAAQEIHCSFCKTLMDSSKELDRSAVLSHFYEASGEAMDDPDLFAKHTCIYRLSASDITAANRNISCLVVAIHDEEYPWVKATIDIVPVFWIQTPTCVKIPDFLKNQTCGAVAKWPSDQPLDQHLFRLSFSLCETEMFHVMPRCLAHAYRLAKIVKDDAFFPIIKNQGLRPKDFISSYLLKTVIAMLYMALRNVDEQFLLAMYKQEDTSLQYTFVVMLWSQAIYRVLGVAIQYGHLESTYIPGYNLLSQHSSYIQYKSVAKEYAQYLGQILNTDQYVDLSISTIVDKAVDACAVVIQEQSVVATGIEQLTL